MATTEKQNEWGKYKRTFARPFKYNDTEITELTFDFSKLTGADSRAIEDECQVIGKAIIMPQFSGNYLVRMAVRACTTPGIGVDAFDMMSIIDYNAIRQAARDFLRESE